MAIDGLANTWWSAGAFAPQWIEIDLGAPTTVYEIRVLTSQSPAGATVHRIRARTADGNWTTLTEFSGNTNDSEWLIFVPNEPLEGIQFIRVDTLSSPSWVGWREIEIIGTKLDLMPR
ncbi:MAG: discoidin domain-containing protein [Chloroflexi bacterium]|nr:discoidin domain-containing protein [Chloroflexota bacterium]